MFSLTSLCSLRFCSLVPGLLGYAQTWVEFMTELLFFLLFWNWSVASKIAIHLSFLPFVLSRWMTQSRLKYVFTFFPSFCQDGVVILLVLPIPKTCSSGLILVEVSGFDISHNFLSYWLVLRFGVVSFSDFKSCTVYFFNEMSCFKKKKKKNLFSSFLFIFIFLFIY